MPDVLKVFIVGSPRSGTSITYYAMREVVGLKGRGESHVVPLFQRIIHQFHTYTQDFKEKLPGVLAGTLDTRSFRDALHAHLRGFYAAAYAGADFVDKTPGAEMIRASGIIYGTFPDARVILMQRNGIEVVNSFRNKFGAPFENACQSWVQVVAASADMLREHGNILVLDQFDLTNRSELAAERIADHLGRPALAARLAGFFRERRVEQNSTHDWRRRLTLADVDWDAAQKARFRDVCGASMDALGYAM